MPLIEFAFIAQMCAFNVDTFRALVFVESSNCRLMTNSKSTARGCGQILKATAKEYSLDYGKLLGKGYSLWATAKVLCDLKRRFPKSYLCAYHLGPKGHKTGDCSEYLMKITKALTRKNNYEIVLKEAK